MQGLVDAFYVHSVTFSFSYVAFRNLIRSSIAKIYATQFGKVYMEEGNKNAGATYKKVANAIKDIEYEITEENAKGLCSKKTKVDGIGKGSADKIYEFLTTGTIAKLEEKRMK